MTSTAITSGDSIARDRPWAGKWVADALDVAIDTEPSASRLSLPDLFGLALRRNPRRAHLLVSTVLGKHLPADPRLVYGAGRLLGALVADRLTGRHSEIGRAGGDLLHEALTATDPAFAAGQLIALCQQHANQSMLAAALPAEIVVLGYAETATGLGHCVAESLAADYLHSTRHRVRGMFPVAGFEEEHSHATSHLLLPEDPGLLARRGPLVLVDDELSTGQTVLNTIAALHRQQPRERYLIASLVDLRSATDRDRLQQCANRLGTRIEVVALARGELTLAPDAAATARLLAARQPDVAMPSQPAGRLEQVLTGWPDGLPEGGRHGFPARCQIALEQATADLGRLLASSLLDGAGAVPPGAQRRILVLGCEELMYAPLRIATELADALDGRASVRYSTTTRSPVIAVADRGYAIRNGISFRSQDDGSTDGQDTSQDAIDERRFAYNLAGTATVDRFSDIVVVSDQDLDPADPAGLLAQLLLVTDRVHPVRLPRYWPASSAPRQARRVLPSPLYGPGFGSYPAADVAWLLTDLSGAELEAPTEEREEAIQSGAAHYAESLPQEYQPSPEYQQLFTDALTGSARRLAHAVGIVTELVLDRRGPDVVLASLARAGTPVGVLMRRWAEFAHQLHLSHYAVSIVRGGGIDTVALAYLAEHHDPASVAFVDGWTGKGAIARELTAAIDQANAALALPAGAGFTAELAVLADPGHCVKIYGTRADYLIPSACLNSTVSGLVSRTVLNADLIGPDQFHGAKFYAELARSDVSMAFIEAVSAEFAAVAEAVSRDWRAVRDSDRRPTWLGWRTVRQIAAQYGITDVNLVKPGVGETTRVLLRRVPWKVLMRADEFDRLGHLVLLARQRGVPIELVDELGYSCIGLIRPGFERRPTGGTEAATKAAAEAEAEAEAEAAAENAAAG